MATLETIKAILADSKHDSSLFTDVEIASLAKKARVEEKQGRKKIYAECVIRNKEILLGPEEVVRQLYVQKLIDEYGYPKNLIELEYTVTFGRQTKRADIVILDKDRHTSPYIIVEVKKPNLIDGKDQLRSYCNATGASIGVWTNGNKISSYHRKDPNYFEEITHIPEASKELRDILKERFTIKNLILEDKLFNEKKSLKDFILEMENEVLANAGVDVFEEVFKLIFTKLFDEYQSWSDKQVIDNLVKTSHEQDYEAYKSEVENIPDVRFRTMGFRNTGQTATALKNSIQDLFNNAQMKWKGVFPENSRFDLEPEHLAICVASLQNVKLFDSNLQVVDEAFEYLVNQSAKGKKGQYFTPRYVIDMCVKMLNPQRGEYIIDTAAGSCGFPIHSIFKLTGNLFRGGGISGQDKKDALRVFGIDFDEKTVRVARTLNLIAGDGETNVLHLNTLDFKKWEEKTEKEKKWIRTYGDGFERLEKLRRGAQNQNQTFKFDILMANPPFAGEMKESSLLRQYQISTDPKGKTKNAIGRHVLFIERNLDFLKPGGRMAIVLPQGIFNNTSEKYVRDFIDERVRILAVIGLHTNTFKPHTGTKTSVLFVQKWDDELCPRKEDYPVFFAVSEKGGKDSSGDYTYLKNGNGREKLDKYGHLIVEHDLHDHDKELEDGIAEEFIKWAKQEGLSFWKE